MNSTDLCQAQYGAVGHPSTHSCVIFLFYYADKTMRKNLRDFLGNYGIIILFMFISVAFRLIPHLPNAAPIGALALFVGIYYRSRWSWAIPLATMLVSDYFIGFYDVRIMLAVYGSFIVYFLI